MSEYIINLDGELGMALAVACAGAGFAREEVVRCRDCALFATDGRWGVCTQFDFETTEENMRDGFCAWGERRDE